VAHRRYLLEPENKIEIIKKNSEEKQQNKVIYARVSSRKQENDLQRQK
jgi:predicted site-specific integrase-resolvase